MRSVERFGSKTRLGRRGETPLVTLALVIGGLLILYQVFLGLGWWLAGPA